MREFAPFVSAIIVAGVAGTAITADLGARKIREELDALQVLGVDPIKNLVVRESGRARPVPPPHPRLAPRCWGWTRDWGRSHGGGRSPVSP